MDAELAQGLAAPDLFPAVPGQNGRIQEAALLVAYWLVQRGVACVNAGHEVRSGDADQGRLLPGC